MSPLQEQNLAIQVARLEEKLDALGPTVERWAAATEKRADHVDERLDEHEARHGDHDAFRNRVVGAVLVLTSSVVVGFLGVFFRYVYSFARP